MNKTKANRLKITNTAFLVESLGSKYSLRIEKWKNEKAWRVGLDWYSQKDYLFICEQPTLLDALIMCMKYDNGYLSIMMNLGNEQRTKKIKK